MKTNKTEEGALNKLGENKEQQLQKPIETQAENLANSAPKVTTKRGRFSLVPAKFQADENEIKTNLVLSEKSSAKISCKLFFYIYGYFLFFLIKKIIFFLFLFISN